MTPPPPPPPQTRGPRSDGVEARSRILYTALRLFAEGGFAKTSTREIAKAAGVNIAAISYYFGDKAGLYSATFNEPMGGNPGDLVKLFEDPELPMHEALRLCMNAYVEPLKRGEIVRQCMRLHMREMVEPTSQWAEELERDVRGPHEALVGILCRHLGVKKADDDVHRLALAVSGLAMQLFVMQDIVDTLRPSLLKSAQSIDTWADRLHRYAMAMIDAEAARRAAPLPPPATKPAAPKPSRKKSP
ncbi:TetR/AcrR family transcriptional regulator [Variovorax sp. LT1R16]|uniref:TetR/AcrR family transcriptional regulator n=1 Tax=Variovorax sp. LT1R16 TaxID=3443728 RepID=UPI003F45E3D9